MLWIDVEKISSAIRNLLSNAFKYTSPRGRVILRMERVQIDGQAFCKLTVSDTGKGIPEELQERVLTLSSRVTKFRCSLLKSVSGCVL